MKKLELTEQEKQAIEAKRDREAKEKELVDKIGLLLKEYSAALAVDPNSAIGNPQIVIRIK